MQNGLKIVLGGIAILLSQFCGAQSMYKENDSLVFHWQPTFDTIPHRSLQPINMELDSIDVLHIQPYKWLDNPYHKILPYKDYNYGKQEWVSHYDQMALDDIGYYYARTPYVSAFYSFGSKQNQALRLFHTQNFGKRFNYAIRYNRDQSLGFLRNDVVNNNNVSLSMHGEFGKYHFRVKGTYYLKKTNESGGLTDPDSSQILSRTLDLIPVNINASEKKYEGAGGTYEQRFYLNDTTGRGLYVVSQHQLYSNAHVYTESGSSVTNFYDAVYFDSTTTGFTQKFNTTAHFIGIGQQLNRLSWSAQTYFRYSEYSQHEFLTSERNLWALGNFKWSSGTLHLDVNARIAYLGTQEGNFKIKGLFQYLDTSYKASLKVNFSSLDPYLQYRHMNANNFQWHQELPTNQKLAIEIQQSFWGEKFLVDLGYVASKDAVYFTADSPQLTPKIYNQTAHLLYLELGTHLSFWKLHWIANVRGQYSRDLEVFNYPLLDATTRFYFDGAIFKSKKLKIQTGFEAQYYTGVNNIGYMPFLDTYYYRPGYGDMGNVLYLDYFLNFKVSSVDVFAKVYHWNSGWLQQGPFYLADDYPVTPFHFRVGVRWQFLN